MDVTDFVKQCEVVVVNRDFAGAVACAAEYVANIADYKTVTKAQIREMVRRAAESAEDKMILEHVGLMDAAISNLVKRIEVLRALQPNVFVCSNSWGFGQVIKVDAFYGRITIDFANKSGHVMSLAVAGQSLTVADEAHIMTRLLNDRQGILDMAAKKPGELIRLFLRSYGPTAVTRIEAILVSSEILTEGMWKKFWESVRRSAKSEKAPIQIPIKRTEPVILLDVAEDYGGKWLKQFKACRVPKSIYDMVIVYLANRKEELTNEYRDAFAARLKYALLGTYKADPSRYVQIACLLERLGYSTSIEIEEQCAYLLDEDDPCYLTAAEGLAARDVVALFTFIQKHCPTCKPVLLGAISGMSSVCLSSFLDVMKLDPETGAEVGKLLTASETVPTLLVWTLRNRKNANDAWHLPSLGELMVQAIHVIEQRLSGEALKMRNTLQSFFDSAKWLDDACTQLTVFERQVVFQRIQAAYAWETASQRNVLTRMIKNDADLARFKRQVATKAVVEHFTSWRSLADLQIAHEHLVRVEMPKNAHDISTARSYGDLRENFEYHTAKDYQRQLISRQEEMDLTLKLIKGADFADATADVVMSGTTVSIDTGRSKDVVYTILGELDRDEALNIISCKSRMALALLGKHVGDAVEIPSIKGSIKGKIKQIVLPNAKIRTWLNFRPEATTETKPQA